MNLPIAAGLAILSRMLPFPPGMMALGWQPFDAGLPKTKSHRQIDGLFIRA